MVSVDLPNYVGTKEHELGSLPYLCLILELLKSSFANDSERWEWNTATTRLSSNMMVKRNFPLRKNRYALFYKSIMWQRTYEKINFTSASGSSGERTRCRTPTSCLTHIFGIDAYSISSISKTLNISCYASWHLQT